MLVVVRVATTFACVLAVVFHPFTAIAPSLTVIVSRPTAQAIGLPFLSPYLQSFGSDYKNGANYATLASTVLLPNTSLFVTGISPFSLAIQLNQMKQFITKANEAGQQETKLPSPDIFGKSLYTFYIGQNDFTSNLAAIGVGGVQESLPQVVSQIAATIKGPKEIVSFRNILSNFPGECNAAANISDISPHLCFICLLHLANENGLSIQSCPNLDDLKICLPHVGDPICGTV